MSSQKQITYVYDKLDRVVEVRHSDGTLVRYTYDAAGNRTSAVVTPALSADGRASDQNAAATAG